MDIKKHSYFIELLVVFIGLSLAFTLDRIWDTYKHDISEQNYLNGFYKDIMNDYTDVDTTITQDQINVDRFRSILVNFGKVGIPEDSLFVVVSMLASQSKFIPHRITYEMLKASGNLELISNYELRQSLSELYLKYDSNQFVEETFNKYISENVFPFLQNNFDFLSNSVLDKNLGKNPVFKNMTAFYYSILNSKLENLKEIKLLSGNVINQLKAELEIK